MTDKTMPDAMLAFAIDPACKQQVRYSCLLCGRRASVGVRVVRFCRKGAICPRCVAEQWRILGRVWELHQQGALPVNLSAVQTDEIRRALGLTEQPSETPSEP